MRVRVSITIDEPIDVVWAEIADLSGHGEWMADAEQIEFVSSSTSGVGTVMRVPTRVGPLVTEDWIIVTEWIEGVRIGVVHVGLVTGAGAISLSPSDDGTDVEWDEQLDLPVVFGGRLGERIARPVLEAIWRSNLRRLAGRF